MRTDMSSGPLVKMAGYLPGVSRERWWGRDGASRSFTAVDYGDERVFCRSSKLVRNYCVVWVRVVLRVWGIYGPGVKSSAWQHHGVIFVCST